MKRKGILLLTRVWLILAMVSAASINGRAAPSYAALKGISVSAPGSGNELLLRIEGEYSFKTVQATEDTIFIDLAGVKAEGVAKNAQWSGGLLVGYRLLQYTDATHQPVVRVQVEMKHRELFQVERDRGGLRVLFAGSSPASATTATPKPALHPAAATASTVVRSEPLPVAPSSGPTMVSGVSIKPASDGTAFVDVATSRPTAYRVLHLDNPPRLVVDFEQARYAARQKAYPASSLVLKGVRVGQFQANNPAVVRVVADLAGDPTFDVHAQPGGVRIELRPRTMTARPTLPREAKPVSRPAAKVEEVELKPPQVAVTTPRPAIPTEQAEQAVAPRGPESSGNEAEAVRTELPSSARVDSPSTLPTAAGLKESAVAARLETQTVTPENLKADRAARILAAESPTVSGAIQGQTPGGAAAGQEKPKYTGEPISLNFKDVDLKDFFRLIHEISGLNIIVDPNVTGTVTMVLDSVPWDQALDIVLKNNRLDKTLEGNVLRIAKVETLSAEQEATSKLAAAREEAQPLVTVFRPVNYAKASTITTMLKSWVGGGALTKRGNILVDDRTNTLIISDIQSQIPIIESIIAKLDKKAKQVSIEARIVLATPAFSRSLQAILTADAFNKSGSTKAAGQSGTGSSVTPVNIFGNIPPVVNLAATSASGFGAFAVMNASRRYFINAAIAAAETKSEAKTISRPSIVTQNNVPGTVQQGTQIPVQTTINNTISIQYVAATLLLTVTPQVTEDGNIFMNINVSNNSPGAAVPGVGTAINTQSATTQVLVPDGGTVVFGGVTVTNRARSATYVPLLGSIPIFGHLFKTSNVTDSDSELLFFVSPKVLPG